MSKIEQTVNALAEPIVQENQCYIYDIEYVKEGGGRFLRVYIDKEGGVGVDDCEKVSRALSEKLDEKDPIKENYFLEISSPGIERRLTQPWHFEKYQGGQVDVSLYRAIQGRKKLTGILDSFDGQSLVLDENGSKLTIPKENIGAVKLHFEFGGI